MGKKMELERMHSFFDKRVESYDTHMQKKVTDFEEFYNAVAKPIQPTQKPIKILDIGCGTGIELVSILAKNPHAEIYCNDVSTRMLSKLKEKYSHFLDQLVFVEGSYLEIVFPERTFDYILSVMTVHHLTIKNKILLYERIRNLLKIDGIYIEGDYVVNEAESAKSWGIYQKIMQQNPELKNGDWHIDIPLPIEKQIQCFRKARFRDIDVCWKKKKAVVITATK